MAIQPQRGGLRWVKSNTNQDSPPIVRLVVASAYATGLFAGDPLKQIADGTCEAAAAGDAISHVLVSVERYIDSEGAVRSGAFLPASTTYTGTVSLMNPNASVVLAIPVANQIFEVDIPDAAASQTAAQAYVYSCIDVVANAGSTSNGQSGYTTGLVATFAASSAQLKLVEIPNYGRDGALNSPTSTYWKGWFEVYEQVTTV
ncbi:MAG: hypothetical protein ACO3SP_09715 [Ilumatobacteraceae bacterium]